MSGNSLILYCQPCQQKGEADYGFKLAGRGIIGAYQPFGPAKQTEQFRNWLRKHQQCGGKGHPDHFGLAHLAERDYDQPKSRPIDIVSKQLFDGAKKVN